MDPQQRFFLEEAWKTFEDAGYAPGDLRRKRCGVFVGCGAPDYRDHFRRDEGEVDIYHMTGLSNSILASRLAYLLDLTGPGMAIDSACSSSLTAIHLACESMWQGSSDFALAGGVCIHTTPQFHVLGSKTGMLSPEGKCKTFSHDADGFVPGEAVGALLLKPFGAALSDGDHIYGVIRGTGMNQDGHTNGITAPNGPSQTELERRVYDRFGINPETIGYVEAHGTGTELGDPIEVRALCDAFRWYTKQTQFCALGSVKANIGHTLEAAGLAGVVKVLLSLKHKQIPPALHVKELNQRIRLEGSPFYVNTELEEWQPKDRTPRRAAISSFGFSGTNAHMVLEEYIQKGEGCGVKGETKTPYLIVLSAKNEDRLKEAVRNLYSFTLHPAAFTLSDLAYTLQVGRDAMEERRAWVVEDEKELREKLKAWLQGVEEGSCQGNVREKKNHFILEGAAGRSFMEVALREKEWRNLAQLWTSGVPIDWSFLYRDRKPLRISLPTYPFARERYWVNSLKVDGGAEKETRTPSFNAPEEKEPTELLTYRELWEEKPWREAAPVTAPVTVLYFAAPGEMESDLSVMRGKGPKENFVVRICEGPAFEKVSETDYRLPRNRDGAYQELFDALLSLERDGIVVIYRWGEEKRGEGIREIYRLLHAVKGSGLEVQKLVLSACLDGGVEDCHAWSWMGYERSLGLALPGTGLMLVYGEPGAVDVDILWKESAHRGLVRYENGKRHEWGAERVRASGKKNSLLAEQGVYLITGGCGGLGELFAGYLAESVGAKLVLTGRRPLSAAIERKLEGLKAKGAKTVVYYQADTRDEARMKEVTSETEKRFGGIHGILHAAGVESQESIFEKSWEAFHEILGPKLEGTVVLDRVTEEMDLDFICFFSSASAWVGDFGSCDYAVGNRFQMAYGRYREKRRREGKRRGDTMVVNWPMWRDGGMGRDREKLINVYLESSGQRYLEAKEGVELWGRLLGAEESQLLVTAGRRSRVERFLMGRDDLEKGERSEKADVEVLIGEDLKKQIVDILKISSDRIGPETSFANFGFDSVTLREFALKLSKHYDMEFAPSTLFSYSTIQSLSAYLAERHRGMMTAFYDQPEMKMGEGPLTSKSEERSGVPGLERSREQTDEPIAIIGVSGRFPGAETMDELWERLSTGRKSLSEVPLERWDWRDYFVGPGNEQNQIATHQGGFIKGVDLFDPLFFEIPPHEAELMDPKQRLLLQEAWRAFEDAGYNSRRLQGRSCGVFVGVEESEYAYLVGDQGFATSNHNGILAARISYFLNLRGPNLAINTSCSSGLTALHHACRSLQQGDCEIALAGGVNLLLTPQAYRSLTRMGMLSADGECRVFEQRASGMVPGEAVVATVLKPFSRAVADGDPIYGVIKASGVNHDGKTNGITAPSALSQMELFEESCERYGIHPEEIHYIMAHSVGSPLGDPMEVEALTDFFQEIYGSKKLLRPGFRQAVAGTYVCGIGSGQPGGHVVGDEAPGDSGDVPV